MLERIHRETLQIFLQVWRNDPFWSCRIRALSEVQQSWLLGEFAG